jgi:hypothetical protein
VSSNSALVQRLIAETWNHRWSLEPYRGAPEWKGQRHRNHG